MSLVFEEARKKIGKDELKEGLRLLEESLGELAMEESAKRGFRNTVIVFLSRYNRIQKEKPNQTPEYFHMQLNALATDMLELINLIEEEVDRGSKAVSPKPSDTRHRVELVVDIDFGESREEELEIFLTSFATMISISPGGLIIISKKTRSIVVETELSAEHILKIKSLVRISLLKELNNIKGFGERKEWMEENRGIYLECCQLSKVNLAEANLSKANLSGADLSGANLSGANLSGANLSWADLSGSTLRGADLNGADLSEANLRMADLYGANLRAVNLRAASLSGANLRNANLKWGNFRGADLKGTDLRGIRLNGADLRWADLSEADLGGVDLREVNLGRARLMKADLVEAVLRNTKLRGTYLSGAYLTGADLCEADLSGADLSGASLIGANLTGADLSKADLNGTDMDRAILIDADLCGAKLSGAKLIGVDLSRTAFHINQAAMLNEINVDISVITFIDDEGDIFKGLKVVK